MHTLTISVFTPFFKLTVLLPLYCQQRKQIFKIKQKNGVNFQQIIPYKKGVILSTNAAYPYHNKRVS